MYATLCNEPWCWTVPEVSGLTDYQAWELVLKPAARRAERLARRANPGKDRPPRGRKGRRRRGGLPTKEEYVANGLWLKGATREQLEADYDRVMGEYHARKGAGRAGNA